jgi:hypothetical protein
MLAYGPKDLAGIREKYLTADCYTKKKRNGNMIRKTEIRSENHKYLVINVKEYSGDIPT